WRESSTRSGGAARLDALDQLLAPRRRSPERGREPLGPAVEHVAVVLPGEADPAVDLDHLLARRLERIAGRRAEAGRGERQLVAPARQRPRRVVAVRACQLDLRVQVGEAVLDRLERRDRAPEGVAPERELARRIESPLRPAELLEAQHHGRAVEQLLDERGAFARFAERLAGSGPERQTGPRAARIRRR